MNEEETRALYARERNERTREALSHVPKTEIARIAARGARLAHAWACAQHGVAACTCGASAARSVGTVDAAIAALPEFRGRDHAAASAYKSTQAARATGKALASALDPRCTGALVRAPQRARNDDATRRVTLAREDAFSRMMLRRRALAACEALGRAWGAAIGRGAPRAERERARSRYRAACHRLGIVAKHRNEL